MLVGLMVCAWWMQPEAPVVIDTVVVEPDVHESCIQPLDTPMALRRGTPLPMVQADPTPTPTPTPRSLRCPAPESILEMQPPGTVLMDRMTGSTFGTVRYEDDAILVTRHSDVVGGTLYLPGFTPIKLTILGDTCTLGVVVPKASVSGEVVSDFGIDDDQIVVQGCGANERLDADGGFYLEIAPEPCTLFAVRRDGPISVRSDPLYLDPQPGEDVLVELVLPSWEATSVGVSLSAIEGDIVLTEVESGGSAEQAGLEPGDRILAIDDQSLEEHSLWEVLDLALGPEGSAIVYTVERDGVAVKVEMLRRP